MDSNGRIAAATSTGGITGKRVGRVGDSPLIGNILILFRHVSSSDIFVYRLLCISSPFSGSGTYCTDEVGGVSCTGHGESIIKICLAKHIICLMENGTNVVECNKFALPMNTNFI